jgi:colanic acid biosynthesis glycosyl transferase WcaI
VHILIHDFAGHPFQVQLSRALAAKGHRITHVYPEGLPGPKGRLLMSVEDPPLFQTHAIPLSSTFRKYSAWRRLTSQRKYARDLNVYIGEEKPDVVLSGNTPIDIQAELLWNCHRRGIGFVHWIQDVYYKALQFVFRRKLGALASLLSFPFELLEKQVARRSDANIAIAPAFRDLLAEWGVTPSQITVLENWAPLDEVERLSRDNEWSRSHGLNGKVVFLYSGTLGLRHRADLLYSLAECLDDNSRVVVVTEGVGRDYLEKLPKRSNLLLLDFQPYKTLPQVLASADVLLATLESDAGLISVPSKVLTYLCAGRPILLAAPEVNLASSLVKKSRAGFVANPERLESWTQAATLLASDSELRSELGINAREYADHVFDINVIAASFERVLAGACRQGSVAEPSADRVSVEI